MKVINASYVIESEINGQEILKQIEKVARTCYKSEDKTTEDSAERMIRSLIKSGHESTIEHASITVRFICDRGVSHEIVRHRIASYGQESTRYCNYSQGKYDNEISVIDIAKGIELDTKMKSLDVETINLILREWYQACEDAQHHYMKMLELDCTPQIARSVLPNSLKTELVVTMNMREWRHFFKLRTDIAAHPQMREVAIPLLKELKSKVPVIFDDIEV